MLPCGKISVLRIVIHFQCSHIDQNIVSYTNGILIDGYSPLSATQCRNLYRRLDLTTAATTATIIEEAIDTGDDDQRGYGREQQAEDNRAGHWPPDGRTAADAKAGGRQTGDGGQRGQDDWPQARLGGGNHSLANGHALGTQFVDKADQHDRIVDCNTGQRNGGVDDDQREGRAGDKQEQDNPAKANGIANRMVIGWV